MCLFRSCPRLMAVGVGCVVAVLLVVALEFGLAIFQKNLSGPVLEWSGDRGLYAYHPDLGVKLRPSIKGSVIYKHDDGRVIFQMQYSFDAYGRRVTPVQNPDQKKHFIVFFGCSNVFGWGLNDNQTLPYYVGKFALCFRPYNYAIGGAGPQLMLAKFQCEDVRSEIPEKNGILICTTAHVARAIGSMHVYNGWAKNYPYYFIDHTGDLKRNGSFTSGRPFLSRLYKMLGASRLARALKIAHPFKIQKKHIELTARIVQESYNLFVKQFRSESFYYVNLPWYNGSNPKEVMDLLKQAGIRCLDYSDRSQFSGKEYRIPDEGHPSAKYNEELAKIIVRDLSLVEHDCKSKAPF